MLAAAFVLLVSVLQDLQADKNSDQNKKRGSKDKVSQLQVSKLVENGHEYKAV